MTIFYRRLVLVITNVAQPPGRGGGDKVSIAGAKR